MAKQKNDFCDPSNYSILIPYRDFVNLVDIARKYDQVIETVKHQDDQLVALRQMFSECLEKIAELDRLI